MLSPLRLDSDSCGSVRHAVFLAPNTVKGAKESPFKSIDETVIDAILSLTLGDVENYNYQS
jgi:hypothetical protein